MSLFDVLWNVPEAGMPSVPTVAPFDLALGPPTSALARLDALTDGGGNAPPLSFLNPRATAAGVGSNNRIASPTFQGDFEEEDSDSDGNDNDGTASADTTSLGNPRGRIDYSICDEFDFFATDGEADNDGVGCAVGAHGRAGQDISGKEQRLLQSLLGSSTDVCGIDDPDATEDEEEEQGNIPQRDVVIRSPYFSSPSRHRRGQKRFAPTPSSGTQQPSTPTSQRPHKRFRPNGDTGQETEDEDEEEEGEQELVAPLYSYSNSVYREGQGLIDGEGGFSSSAPQSPSRTAPDSQDLLLRMSRIRPGQNCCDTYPQAGEPEQVWCFGCRWGAPGHKPVDNLKIREFVREFVNLIMDGSTSEANIATVVEKNYEAIIRRPAMALGQTLPRWPASVVLRHIYNMTEPRIVNSLVLRRQKDLVYNLHRYAFDGGGKPDLAVIRVLNQSQRELRELYRPVTKDAFGYNEHLTADTWKGSIFVHPERVARTTNSGAGVITATNTAAGAQDSGGAFPGAPIAARPEQAGVRQPAVSAGGQDTGALRGPANDEELVRRV